VTVRAGGAEGQRPHEDRWPKTKHGARPDQLRSILTERTEAGPCHGPEGGEIGSAGGREAAWLEQ
jgi:hypothetical protein